MTKLTFADLRKADADRQAYWGGAENWTLADWSNALAGEVGEVCNVVKKLRRPHLGTVGNDFDAAHYTAQLGSEIGDVLIYLDLLAKAAGLDLAECAQRAFNEKSAKLDMPVRLEPEPVLASNDLVKSMVNRFLGWRLPDDFSPDGGISFQKVGNAGTTYEYRYEPTGTNLLTATQATAMVEHMFEGISLDATPPAPVDWDNRKSA